MFPRDEVLLYIHQLPIMFPRDEVLSSSVEHPELPLVGVELTLECLVLL